MSIPRPPSPRSTVSDLYDATQWSEIPGIGPRTARIIVEVLRRRQAIADNSPNGELAKLEAKIDKLWKIIFSKPIQDHSFLRGNPGRNLQERVEALEMEVSCLNTEVNNDGWPRD